MSCPAKNNAFGQGSPSWNLPFPVGNLTAAEIVAYLPHWLKSVDVIDRFVTNGARAWTIAAMVNEFRYPPISRDGDPNFRPNSATKMMAFAMRKAGYDNWTIGSHIQFKQSNPELNETDLNVQSFRTPRMTHPKYSTSGRTSEFSRSNEEAKPVEFKTLALHVKKHPSDHDALDLARCVQYSVIHLTEQWYFPRDYETLVNKLGGPAKVTHSHLDSQVFNRRVNYVFPPLVRFTPTPKRTRNSPIKYNHRGNAISLSRMVSAQKTTLALGSPLKFMMDAAGMARVGGTRKSGRLANKASVSFREYDSDATDDDTFDSTQSARSTMVKRRKLSGIPLTPGIPVNDSDFVQDDSEPDEEVPEADDASEEELLSPIMNARSRAAAQKARRAIRSLTTDTQRNIKILSKKIEDMDTPLLTESSEVPQALPILRPKSITEVSPEMMSLARAFSTRQPEFLNPPKLSASRLRVDASSIYLYAADGCNTVEEMWDTALSSTRFNGPRRHPPFRELYRLTAPRRNDDSDWAENIRWAKEQYQIFGSKTWTEYDYHLELITEHRRAVLWVSEEAISGGM
ncbi:hypothetical protein GQ44DRAFT_681043 [Phaeosphaeriaceae sp. PMI808]|nr:hypothetical protein GQ44DRAFT_681043 [Phaeosphaeriaceae sp. PMI808]